MSRYTLYNWESKTYELVNENTPVECLIQALGEYEAEENVLSFGEMLAKVRKNKGLTQFDLANRLDLSQAIVYDWESGKLTPSWDTILKLVALLESYKLRDWYERAKLKEQRNRNFYNGDEN